MISIGGKSLLGGKINGKTLLEVWLNNKKIWPESSLPSEGGKTYGLVVKSDTTNFLAYVQGAENEYPERLYKPGTDLDIEEYYTTSGRESMFIGDIKDGYYGRVFGPITDNGEVYTLVLKFPINLNPPGYWDSSNPPSFHIQMLKDDLTAHYDLGEMLGSMDLTGAATMNGTNGGTYEGIADGYPIMDPERPRDTVNSGSLFVDVYADFSWKLQLKLKGDNISSIEPTTDEFLIQGHKNNDYNGDYANTPEYLKKVIVKVVDSDEEKGVVIDNGLNSTNDTSSVPGLIMLQPIPQGSDYLTIDSPFEMRSKGSGWVRPGSNNAPDQQLEGMTGGTILLDLVVTIDNLDKFALDITGFRIHNVLGITEQPTWEWYDFDPGTPNNEGAITATLDEKHETMTIKIDRTKINDKPLSDGSKQSGCKVKFTARQGLYIFNSAEMNIWFLYDQSQI